MSCSIGLIGRELVVTLRVACLSQAKNKIELAHEGALFEQRFDDEKLNVTKILGRRCFRRAATTQ